MNPALPQEAAEFGATVEKALTAFGGVDLAREAEVEPDVRTSRVARALAGLGADQIDPRSDLDTAAAAGELCRAAGRVVLPYPVVGVLLQLATDGLPFALVPMDRLRVNHGDLFEAWRVATIDGHCYVASPSGPRLGSRLGPFVTDLAPTGDGPARPAPTDVAMHLTLTAWQILGGVERVLELAIDHVNGRVQFGQPIAAFQAVQFQLADAAVARDGLRELARFTLWRMFVDPDGALADALALRLHALDVARVVLRTSQQLHGAAGLCDEYDVSVIVRQAQPELRLPFGAARTAAQLVDAVRRVGFVSLFPHGGATP